jgi:hypothetical protein
MKTSNFISLSLTGLAVKTYMLIGIVWSKANEATATAPNNEKVVTINFANQSL